jgi:hypothetical protein
MEPVDQKPRSTVNMNPLKTNMSITESLKEEFSSTGKSAAAFRALYDEGVLAVSAEDGIRLRISTRDAVAMATDEALDPRQAAVICFLLNRGSSRQAMSDADQRVVARAAVKLSQRICSELFRS